MLSGILPSNTLTQRCVKSLLYNSEILLITLALTFGTHKLVGHWCWCPVEHLKLTVGELGRILYLRIRFRFQCILGWAWPRHFISCWEDTYCKNDDAIVLAPLINSFISRGPRHILHAYWYMTWRVSTHLFCFSSLFILHLTRRIWITSEVQPAIRRRRKWYCRLVRL